MPHPLHFLGTSHTVLTIYVSVYNLQERGKVILDIMDDLRSQCIKVHKEENEAKWKGITVILTQHRPSLPLHVIL